MNWLVTGGGGYIGAHVTRAMIDADLSCVVLDNLSTGSRDRIPDDVPHVEANVADIPEVRRVLTQHECPAVMHLAGSKSVAESTRDPVGCFERNVGAFRALLSACADVGVKQIVFSSSAAVYGNPGTAFAEEGRPCTPESPYGQAKLRCESILEEFADAHEVRWAALRYFNVIGAAHAGLADRGSGNLVPNVVAAVRSGRPLAVYGGDHPTPDGTCIRDYVDVADVAAAQVAAARALAGGAQPGVLNIGTGVGTSVLDMLHEIGRNVGRPVSYEFASPRAGDAARVVAATERAAAVLGWRAATALDEAVRHAVRDVQIVADRTVG